MCQILDELSMVWRYELMGLKKKKSKKLSLLTC